jgi:hypothetical protein
MLINKAKKDFDDYLSENSLCYLMGINKDTFYDFPFHMQYGMFEKFFFDKGLVIDKNTKKTIYKIWDYREEEPINPTVLDFTYIPDQTDAMQLVIGLINKIYNKDGKN